MYNLHRSFEVQASPRAKGIAMASATAILILRSLGRITATSVPNGPSWEAAELN